MQENIRKKLSQMSDSFFLLLIQFLISKIRFLLIDHLTLHRTIGVDRCAFAINNRWWDLDLTHMVIYDSRIRQPIMQCTFFVIRSDHKIPDKDNDLRQKSSNRLPISHLELCHLALLTADNPQTHCTFSQCCSCEIGEQDKIQHTEQI